MAITDQTEGGSAPPLPEFLFGGGGATDHPAPPPTQ